MGRGEFWIILLGCLEPLLQTNSEIRNCEVRLGFKSLLAKQSKSSEKDKYHRDFIHTCNLGNKTDEHGEGENREGGKP